ncbi:zinc-ribbon domain-containing protein [Candidatus Pelagibacter sp.]|nr:zinc-ribbon domain-containing protein [Candidatus Pelagibacter sp.]
MIISCEKCNKKFELDEKLIPENGRLLQCGSCSYKWHYLPVNKTVIKKEIKLLDDENHSVEKKINLDIKKSNKNYSVESKISINNKPILKNNKKKTNLFNLLLVFIISVIAIIVLIDTTKTQLSNFIPNIDFYLLSLYESLRDIFLFIKDLIK